jgi:hypothetical protein
MFCDGAMIASTIASLMMNGVCCMWQMQEEEDRRHAIRSDIRVEYERQRLLDLERWAEATNRRNVHIGDNSAIHPLDYHYNLQKDQQQQQQDDRRRALLVSKLSVLSSKNQRRDAGKEERDCASIHSSVASTRAVYDIAYAQEGGNDEKATTTKKIQNTEKRTIRKWKLYDERRADQFETATRAGSDMSSILFG